ncbi:MAG: histidine phosphatase family protein [Lachnospiraceae bacterium]|nr:histidine phosphatase family protein [Lachnospiraceae bacterium]
MKKRSILIRHAKTQGNESGRFLGCRSDEPLSDTGRADTLNARNGIRRITGDGILLFTSPMIRAKETAGLLFDNMDMTVIDDLKELDFGILDGHTHIEMDGDPRYQAWIDSGGRDRVPGGETMDELIERSMRAFAHIIKTSLGNDKDAVIVCHGGNIMSVMCTLAANDFYNNIVPNLDGYILELETKNERIDLLSYDRLSDRVRA